MSPFVRTGFLVLPISRSSGAVFLARRTFNVELRTFFYYFFSKLVKTNCEKLVKLNLLITSISKTIHYSLLVIHYKTAGFVRVRDLEGAEGGTSWSERRDGCSEMGSIISGVYCPYRISTLPLRGSQNVL